VEASVQGPPARGAAAYLGELLGTFGLVFFICMAVSEYGVGGDFVAIALVHVFVLFMLIQTLAVVCGAHFNPAVTVAMVALRQIRPPDAVIYVVVQLTGGILGALATRAAGRLAVEGWVRVWAPSAIGAIAAAARREAIRGRCMTVLPGWGRGDATRVTRTRVVPMSLKRHCRRGVGQEVHEEVAGSGAHGP